MVCAGNREMADKMRIFQELGLFRGLWNSIWPYQEG